MRKFIKEAWDITVEHARSRKAMRILNKQEWSVEFLEKMLIKAAKCQGTELEMDIVSPRGAILRLRTVDIKIARQVDEDIFDHLDDENKMRMFIQKIQGK